MKKMTFFTSTLLLTLIGTAAWAQAPAAAPVVATVHKADTAWMMVSTMLVMLMVPGLALFYGGLVRARNVLSVFMHCIVIACVASVLWLIVGYSVAFTEGNEEDQIPLLRITNEDEQRQRKRLDAVRDRRDTSKVDAVLARLRSEAADSEINLMPTLIEAAQAYATLGEIMSAMGSVFGRHVEVPTF